MPNDLRPNPTLLLSYLTASANLLKKAEDAMLNPPLYPSHRLWVGDIKHIRKATLEVRNVIGEHHGVKMGAPECFEGWSAFLSGKQRDANPYPVDGTEEEQVAHRNWRQGYDDAFESKLNEIKESAQATDTDTTAPAAS